MPASEHKVFKQPNDPNAAIWRYMDFTKFVSMLESQALYFSRADRLGDPFEGSYSRGNERLRAEVYKDFYKDIPAAKLMAIRTGQANFNRWYRHWVFVNCWHMNPTESAAMWKLYAKSNEAVAVKSSFSRLSNALDEKVYLGMVEYIDFDSAWLPEGNAFYPFVHKRLSFAHEHEVRAVFAQDLPLKGDAIDLTAIPTYEGLERKVDLDKIVDTVFVAPTCPRWFSVLVAQVCVRYGLNAKVVQSALDEEPFF
jgi:hypothetical protein